MTSTVLDMSISLDGYVAGPNEGPDNGLGDGGTRLHEWVLDNPTGVNAEYRDQILGTGAVVSGPTTFELAHGWGGDHHDGVPIFIVSGREPGIDVSSWPLVTYVSDVETAISEARDAAAGADVLMHGVYQARRALEAGVLDEIQLHVVPIVLGAGRSLFEGYQPARFTPLDVAEGEGVTHLRYDVRP